jgi:cytochrome c-type biogenesis protein CcmH
MVNHWLPMLAGLVAALMAALVLWPLRQHGRGFVVGVLALGVAGACLYLLVGDRVRAGTDRAVGGHPARWRAGTAGRTGARPAACRWLGIARPFAGRTGQRRAAADAFASAAALARKIRACWWKPRRRAQADAGKQFDDTAMAWLQQARAQAPDAERASWLLGIALRQRGKNAEAADVWSGLLPRLEPGAAQALRHRSPSRARPPARRRCWRRRHRRCCRCACSCRRLNASGQPAPRCSCWPVPSAAADAGGRSQAAAGRIPGHGRAGRR